MSKRELQRGGVLARVKAGELRLKDAAEVMRTSYRQARRLWKRYQEIGAAALKHGNAGRTSNRARPGKERKKILKLVRENTAEMSGRASGRRWRRSTWRARTR